MTNELPNHEPQDIFSAAVDLPKKRVGTSMMIVNENEEIIIVKPVYREYWSLPGGIVEQHESPRSACIREVKEEVGIDIVNPRCLCVHWEAPTDNKEESVRFVFLGASTQTHFNLESSDEIAECRFSPITEALRLMNKTTSALVRASLKALQNNRIIYFEDDEELG